MKICKQCRRCLGDEAFRPTPKRGTGARNTTTGSNTLCRLCESQNIQAHNIVKAMDEGRPYNEGSKKRLVDFYAMLDNAGIEICTAAARRLMGKDPLDNRRHANAKTVQLSSLNELYLHVQKLRNREYSSFEEAEEIHNQLLPRLKQAGLYEEANNLVDEWFEEGDE